MDFLLSGDNWFMRTIFKPLFANFSFEEIVQRYKQIRNPIKKLAGKIIHKKLSNIEHNYREHKKQLLTLPEQIKTQSQRIIDFSTTYAIENKQTKKRLKNDLIELKAKMDEIMENQYVV